MVMKGLVISVAVVFVVAKKMVAMDAMDTLGVVFIIFASYHVTMKTLLKIYIIF